MYNYSCLIETATSCFIVQIETVSIKHERHLKIDPAERKGGQIEMFVNICLTYLGVAPGILVGSWFQPEVVRPLHS